MSETPGEIGSEAEDLRALAQLRVGVSLGGAALLLVVGVAPIELSRTGAAAVSVTGLALLASSVYGIRRLRQLLHDWSQRHVWPGLMHPIEDPFGFRETASNIGQVLRAIGPAVLALTFITAWTLLLMLLWAADATVCSLDLTEPCHGAFRGLGEHVAVSDFVYLAVNGAVASTPPDIIPTSRVAHMALAVEFASGAVLIGAYAVALVTGPPAQKTGSAV